MALLDRFRKSKNQVNDLPNSYGYGNFFFTPLDKKNWDFRKFSDQYLWLILQTIFAGMKNVRFFSDSEDERIEKIVYFLDKNFITLIWNMWHLGFAVVGIRSDGTYYIPEKKEIQRDRNGKVTNFDVVYYSEKYMFERKSDFSIIADSLYAIDAFANGNLNLTENFGALGILMGKGLPTSPADKEDFQKQLKNEYGIKKEQKQIILTTMPLDFKQFTLPVAQLKLPENIEREMKLLFRYFNVPTDLIIGGSTFDNQTQATLNFYRNCISPLAEIALKIGQYLMKKDVRLLVPTDKLTFRIDNVAELEDDRTPEIELKLKVVELVERMRAMQLDTSEYEDILTKLTM